MSRYECGECGLDAMDLPDGVDLEFIFERAAALAGPHTADEEADRG